MEHLSKFAYVDTKLLSSNKTYSELNLKSPCSKTLYFGPNRNIAEK